MNTPRQHTIATPYIVGPVHFYSATLGGDLVLFDCGPPTRECRNSLKQQLDLPKLRHVILTHGHVDHWGQALWLAEQGINVYIPFNDHLKICHHDRRQKEMLALLEEADFPPSLLRHFARMCREEMLYPSFPPGYKIVEQDLPPHLGLTVHPCPGHSTSDLVFEGDGWLISGDTLLAGIFQTPLLDVDLKKGGRFLNYNAWCASLVKLAKLEGRRICPGHRESPGGVRSTLLEYLQTLFYRVSRFLPHQGESNFLEVIKRALDGRIKGPFHIYLKASEIVFIKDFLNDPDRLRQSLIRSGLYLETAENFEEIVRQGREAPSAGSK